MSNGTRVLVAHYDADQAESMRAALTEAGAEVVVATSGEEALEAARRGGPSLAFVSTLLPGTHGFEVCRQLSATPPSPGEESSVSVILLTDQEDPYVRARARHVGAKQVVLEPLTADALQSLLEVPWHQVDPLALPGDEDGDQSPPAPDGLMRDLMDPSGPADGDVMGQLVDPVSGLANESYTRMKVDEEVRRANRYGHELSLLIAQIEDYPAFSREFGSAAADEAVLDVAGVFLCESRDIDLAGLDGPGRFLLLMPNTPAEGAQVVADRFREGFRDRTIELSDRAVPMPIRVGVATRRGGREPLTRDLLMRAVEDDLRLRRANTGS